MKTKDKILATALKMFNAQGITGISSRNISDKIGISYGNLTYHFPKKTDIIRQLYLNMQEELNQQFQNLEQQLFELNFMIGSLRGLFQILYKYKFIYLGITKVTRQFDEIRQHAIEQYDVRQKIMLNIARFMTQEGFLKPEKKSGEMEYKVKNLMILVNSWILDSEIFYKGKEEDKVEYYLEVFYNALKPSLTKEGREIFEKAYHKEGSEINMRK